MQLIQFDIIDAANAFHDSHSLYHQLYDMITSLSFAMDCIIGTLFHMD